MTRTVSGTARFVYAGPGNEEAGALNKSGIALYIDGEKEESDIYRVDDLEGSEITQHAFRDYNGKDLIVENATVSIGVGKATSKMVTIARIKDKKSLRWE